jgi:ABC-type nitrate/sulfonate/bicarbonate transport system substrate-binding protein
MRRRTISRRGLFGQASGLAIATLLPSPAIAEIRQVKFTLPWLPGGPYAFVYMANAKGYMKERGFDMSIARGFGSYASAQSISAGNFDCGLCAAPALTLSVTKGLPLIALATTEYDATMGVGVLADSPIKKPQDLAGKKIASVPTSAEFPFLPAYAEKVGLDINTIESVHVDNKVIEHVLEEKQVDAITNFATGSYATMMSQGFPSRWMLYSAAGIKNSGQTIAVTKTTLAKDPALCEAFVGGLLEGIAFTLTNPDETVELFLKQIPEMALNPNAKAQTRLGLAIWQHSVEHPESRAHGLGWCDPDAFTEMTDLVMQYLAEPGMQRPDHDALFTNQFSGKIKLDETQWTQVRNRVSAYDKVFG